MTTSDIGGTVPVEDGSSRSLYKNVRPSIRFLPQLKNPLVTTDFLSAFQFTTQTRDHIFGKRTLSLDVTDGRMIFDQNGSKDENDLPTPKIRR